MVERLVRRVLRALERHGLLLETDAELSLVGKVTGGRVRGSWWSHPLGALIYTISLRSNSTGNSRSP